MTLQGDGSERADASKLDETNQLDRPPEPGVGRLPKLVCHWLGVPIALLWLYDEAWQHFNSSHGLATPATAQQAAAWAAAIGQQMLKTAQPLLVNDTRLESSRSGQPLPTEPPIGAYVGVPIFTPERQVMGILCALEPQPRTWQAEAVTTLTMLAELATSELHLYQQLQQQQLVEAKLRATNELLQAVIDGSSDGIYVRDLAGHYLLVNPAAAATIGLPPEGIVGQDFRRFFRPENVAQLESGDRQLIETGEIHHAEFTWFERDQLRTFHSVRTPLRDRHGQCTGILNVIRDITERKQVEAELRRSEARFRELADAMPQIVWVSGPSGAIQYLNRQWTLYTGLPIERSIGFGAVRCIHREDRAAALAKLSAAINNGNSFEVEFRLRRFDGRYRWHLVRGVPVHNEAGQLLRWYCTATDIDERKRAENHSQFLIELDGQIQLLSEPAEIIWNAMDALRTYLAVSYCYFSEVLESADAAPSLYNWQRARVASETAPLAPQLLAQFLSSRVISAADVLTDPQTAPVAQQLIEKNVQAFVNLPLIQEGRWVVSLIVQHAEARDWAADELELLHAVVARVWPLVEWARAIVALRTNEVNYRALFEGAGDAIFLTNQDGFYLDVNAQACRLSGYTRAELIGKHLRDLTPVANWPRLESDPATTIREWQLLRKDGVIVPVEVSAKQLNDGRWQAFVRDVTERKRYEQQLRRLNTSLEERVRERTAELERSNRELDQFAYVASHDLKAPLRGIEHLALWITEDARDLLPESSKQHLDKLRSRVKRLDALLDDLLAYARAGRFHHTPEPVDLAALVRELFELLTPPTGFQLENLESLPTLVLERVPLETVLRNLLSNALKHHHQPDKGRIRLGWEAQGNFIRLAISDNGPGIDPVYHERIFEIFQTLQPRDRVEGSGIGLAVVKRLLESRGGVIQVDSSVGAGATFYFTWPYSQP